MLWAMDLAFLADTVRSWEQRGQLQPGEAVVVGHHEPQPLPGALRVGGADGGGRSLVEELAADATWTVLRRYPAPDAAADHAFDRLGSLTASRYWGADEWGRIRARVRAGAVLRTASLLVCPEWELGGDRWDLAARFADLGIEPEGLWWLEGVDGLPEPDELVTQLRVEGDDWVVGVTERGLFRVDGRYSRERDACARVLRDVYAHLAVSMGTGDEPVHVTEPYRDAVRAALHEALALVDARG